MVGQKPIPRQIVTWLDDLSHLNWDFCIKHLIISRMFITDVKSTELQVEKRHKQLQDWRSTEAKAKAKSYAATKDNEKCQVGLWWTQVCWWWLFDGKDQFALLLQDQLLDCKLGRGRQLSDKEQIKLQVEYPANDHHNAQQHHERVQHKHAQAKRKKSETAVRKSDMEYYAACIKTERSRLDWEGAVKRGAKVVTWSSCHQVITSINSNLSTTIIIITIKRCSVG